MDYHKRFFLGLCRAVWGPTQWYGWIWRLLLLVGFVPAYRARLAQPMLEAIGLGQVPSSSFVIFALAVLSIGLAWRLAAATTSKVIFAEPSLTKSSHGLAGRLPVKISTLPKELCRIELQVLKMDGSPAITSKVSLMTENRLKRVKNGEARYVGRINLDDQFKNIELFEYDDHLKRYVIEHDAGTEKLEPSSYRFLVSVMADSGSRSRELSLLFDPKSETVQWLGLSGAKFAPLKLASLPLCT